MSVFSVTSMSVSAPAGIVEMRAVEAAIMCACLCRRSRMAKADLSRRRPKAKADQPRSTGSGGNDEIEDTHRHSLEQGG
jgi:hypothetical protein